MDLRVKVPCVRCQVVKFDPWDMPNNCCIHIYTQKSLFIGENGNAFFSLTPSCDKRTRTSSQLKQHGPKLVSCYRICHSGLNA